MQILVTTDRSERSMHVFPHAAVLARAADVPLTVLEVVPPAERAEAKQMLEALVEREALPATVQTADQREDEPVAKVVLRAAEELRAGLIAMDTRGTGRVHHAVVGSVAAEVVGGGCFPVMLTGSAIKPPRVDGEYQIAITNDGSEAALDVVRALRPMLGVFSPRIVLVRVYEPRLGDRGLAEEMEAARVDLERLRETFPDPARVTVRVEPMDGIERTHTAVVRAAESAQVNAIAMSTHGHNAMRHLFAGSTTMGVIAHSSLPVIVARCGD